MFHHPVQGREAGGRLLDFSQGMKSVALPLRFVFWLPKSGYDCALRPLFRRGLSSSLKDELAVRADSTNLEDLICLTIRLDNLLRERNRERGFKLLHVRLWPGMEC